MTSSTPTRPSTPVRIVALGVVAALLLFLAGGLFAANANADSHKVWVCKYVRTPGGDEVLKEGKNPISVGMKATVGDLFKDAQELSYVVAVDDGRAAPECDPNPPEHEEELPPLPPVTPDDEDKDESKDDGTKDDEEGTTTPAKKPVAAPTDLGSSQATGLFFLFAIAGGLLAAGGVALRGARD